MHTNISVKNNSKITIHVGGTQLDLSLEDARKLRDLLTKELGDSIWTVPQPPQPPQPLRPDYGELTNPVPTFPRPVKIPYPGWDPSRVTCSTTTHDVEKFMPSFLSGSL
jgi:hypothetical protein